LFVSTAHPSEYQSDSPSGTVTEVVDGEAADAEAEEEAEAETATLDAEAEAEAETEAEAEVLGTGTGIVVLGSHEGSPVALKVYRESNQAWPQVSDESPWHGELQAESSLTAPPVPT
jgi:hypothetical protein